MKTAHQDIMDLIEAGWQVGYSKRPNGDIHTGFAIKGQMSRPLNARIIHKMFSDGTIDIDMEKSLIKQQEMFDLSQKTGFAGILLSEEDIEERRRINSEAEKIGFYGRIKFRIPTYAGAKI